MFIAATLALLSTMAVALLLLFRGPSLYDRVLAANLFADAVRDAFDPRVRVGARPVFSPVLSLNKAA